MPAVLPSLLPARCTAIVGACAELCFFLLVAVLFARGVSGQTPETPSAAERMGQSVGTDPEGEQWARNTLKRMSLEEKVGQMFVISARSGFLNVNAPEYLQLRDTVRRFHIGAVVVTVPGMDRC